MERGCTRRQFIQVAATGAVLALCGCNLDTNTAPAEGRRVTGEIGLGSISSQVGVALDINGGQCFGQACIVRHYGANQLQTVKHVLSVASTLRFNVGGQNYAMYVNSAENVTVREDEQPDGTVRLNLPPEISQGIDRQLSDSPRLIPVSINQDSANTLHLLSVYDARLGLWRMLEIDEVFPDRGFVTARAIIADYIAESDGYRFANSDMCSGDSGSAVLPVRIGTDRRVEPLTIGNDVCLLGSVIGINQGRDVSPGYYCGHNYLISLS